MIAALSCVPGPAVLLVISSALQRGFRIGIAASLGILAGNLIYFALSGTSIGAMLVASRRTYLAAKWAGAA
jgi:homoserine/homoserine lactone efflux protein